MKDYIVYFCCKLKNIGLYHIISKGQLNAYISKSMAIKRIGIGNDEGICILDGVNLVGLVTLDDITIKVGCSSLAEIIMGFKKRNKFIAFE